jgi:hypothetical protein
VQSQWLLHCGVDLLTQQTSARLEQVSFLSIVSVGLQPRRELTHLPLFWAQSVEADLQSAGQEHSFSPVLASHLPSPHLTQTNF